MTISTDITCPSPSIINSLYQNGFTLTIAAFPELSFWCKDCSLPDVSIAQAEQYTPFQKNPMMGTLAEFGQLSCTVICDEKMSNYRAIYDWMRLGAFKDDWTQVQQWIEKRGYKFGITKNNEILLTSSATLIIRGANQSEAGKIVINNVWPNNLSGLQLTEETVDSQVVTFTVSFTIRDFDFVD